MPACPTANDEQVLIGMARGRATTSPRCLAWCQLIRLLAEGLKENRCEQCGISDWQGKPLNMQLHHLNGNGTENRLENVVFLCGNCHSQTDTYGGRNGHRRPRRSTAKTA
jgi:hypothetical protein